MYYFAMCEQPAYSPREVPVPDESTEVFGQVHTLGGWVLINDDLTEPGIKPGQASQANKAIGAEQRFFLVWTSEEPLDHSSLLACAALCRLPPFIKDLTIQFDAEPTPGFVLYSRSGFGFESRLLSEKTMEKILWEFQKCESPFLLYRIFILRLTCLIFCSPSAVTKTIYNKRTHY